MTRNFFFALRSDRSDDAAGPMSQSSPDGGPTIITPVGEPEWSRDAESDGDDWDDEELLGEDSDNEAFRATLESFMKGENPSWSPAREEPAMCYCAPPWQDETVYWDDEFSEDSTDASRGTKEPQSDVLCDASRDTSQSPGPSEPLTIVPHREVPQSPGLSMPTLDDVEIMLK